MDKFIYSLLGWIDERMSFLNKIVDDVYTFDFPNCKPKKKINENKRKH
jgi:hypothetical protein